MSDFRARTGRFLNIREVTAETSLSRATIYRMIAKGQFPAGIRISDRRVTWRTETIEAWKNRQAPLDSAGA